jgi:hypothetical protein
MITSVFPAPGEMEASLHINNTTSSILDSVFVCRREVEGEMPLPDLESFSKALTQDCREMAKGGVRVNIGDARCLFMGHIVRLAVRKLVGGWDCTAPTEVRLERVARELRLLAKHYEMQKVVAHCLTNLEQEKVRQLRLLEDTDGAAI